MQEQNVVSAAPQDEEFERQLEERISAMEKDGYQFPPRMGKKDYISVAIVAAVCLVLIIAGGAL